MAAAGGTLVDFRSRSGGHSLRTRSRKAYDLAVRLERSEARFRNVIERNADAIVVVDETGSIRYVNQAAEALFGRGRAELLLHPFGFPLVSGETTELELPAKGGSPRVVEMRVVESDWEDQPAYLASLRDITERKEAEEQARRLVHERVARESAEQAAQRMRFLANSLTRLTSQLHYADVMSELADVCVRQLADLAIVYGVDGEGVLTRREVSYRDPAHESLARELRSDPVAPASSHPVYEVLRSQRSLLVRQVSAEQRLVPATDVRSMRWIDRLGVASLAIVPMIARDHPVGALSIASTDSGRLFDEDQVALVEDLAHRAALALDNAWLYAKSQEAIRAQTDLIAMISHDLRTPLTSMLGYAELLSLGIPEPLGEGARTQLGRIQSSGRHVLYLIEQLATFARLDADRNGLVRRETAPMLVAQEVRDLLEPLARERGLDFTVDVDARLPPLVTDAGKLRQILVNLAGNAIKFTERGSVGVRAASREDGIAFEVRDTGIGIDARYLEEIFQPFWQVPRDGPSDGAGLGLSIVHRLVSRLGGRVDVQSAPGVGSTFTVTLPSRRP
jgi:signal transduction histidine kinase